MIELKNSHVKKLYEELGEYGKTLGSLEQVSKDVFSILNLDDENEMNYAKCIKNLQSTERFPMHNKITIDNVFSHQIRLSETINELDFFMEEVLNKDEEKINHSYCYCLALVHDDSEGISPLKDIPTTLKLGLSETSKNILSILEENYIDVLLKFHEEESGSHIIPEFKKMYLDSENKTSIEGQLVSYLDKVDGFMFCLHELYNGNKEFIEPFKNYITILTGIKKDKNKYPKIRFLLDGNIDGYKYEVDKMPDFDMDDDSEYDKSIFKKSQNRNSNVLELFNIEGLLKLDDNIDDFLSTEVIDKKSEYGAFPDIDMFPDLDFDIYTTNIKSYESWKIAYAKVNYIDFKGKIISGNNLMYDKKAS